LADHSGISLGQVNYILKSLLKKGLVKVDNFRKNPDKLGYVYLLTPKGIEAKSRLAVRFVIRKIREYNEIKERLTERLITIEKAGLNRIIFIGPPTVRDFIDKIIKEKNLNVILIDTYSGSMGHGKTIPVSFDIALLFDDNPEGVSDSYINTMAAIPSDKVMTLW
jgi:EPS-associated MarR family transcriptional regulator